MKKDQPSQGQAFCEFGGVEKSGEHLLDIAGLPGQSNCSTIMVQQSKGGATMEEKIKQAEGEEELLQQESELKIDEMRRFIIGAAQSLSNEKLLRMLYIRAKTLKQL